MDIPPAILAARTLSNLVLAGPRPTDAELACALDQLAAAYHHIPDAQPSPSLQEPPEKDHAARYRMIGQRFPDYGYYAVANPAVALDEKPLVGDAVDDLADIVDDLEEASWRFDHLGQDDAHWYLRLHYFHWGRHLRELSLYLHVRQFWSDDTQG